VVAGPLLPLLGTGLPAAIAAAWEYAHQRNPEALAYPLINGILGSVFLFGLVRGLGRMAVERPADRAVAPTALVTAHRALGGGQLAGASQ
jgi:hypothetical protein